MNRMKNERNKMCSHQTSTLKDKEVETVLSNTVNFKVQNKDYKEFINLNA